MTKNLKGQLQDLSFTRHLQNRSRESRESRINLVFQLAPEKLGRFETKGWNFLVLKNVLFFSTTK